VLPVMSGRLENLAFLDVPSSPSRLNLSLASRRLARMRLLAVPANTAPSIPDPLQSLQDLTADDHINSDLIGELSNFPIYGATQFYMGDDQSTNSRRSLTLKKYRRSSAWNSRAVSAREPRTELRNEHNRGYLHYVLFCHAEGSTV
jgi:hypothetical protein